VSIGAHTTLTLALPKTGLGGDGTGHLWLADIGIPRAAFGRAKVAYADPFGTRYRVPIVPTGAGPSRT
jgi:NAD(P)H-hydrate epimerase